MESTSGSARGRPRPWGVIAVFAASLAGLLLHARVYAFLCDDAFISFRYARNLAEGHGLVFNPGFDRVEGYTNFLWVVLLAAAPLLGFAPEDAANPILVAATIALWGLVVWFSWRSRVVGGPLGAVVVPALMLAATRSVAVWSTSGLETRLFELLVVGATLRLAVEVEAEAEGGPGRLRVAAALYALAALTRPDGILMGGAAILAGHALLRVKGRWRPRGFVADAAVFALVVGAHFLWRRAYYGDWLPNTYYVKAAGRAWWGMGGTYLGTFLLEYMAILWAPLLVLGILARLRRGSAQVPLLFAAVTIPHALYVASIGGDHFEWRPLDLYFPFLFLLVGDGVSALAARVRPRSPGAVAVGAWLALVLAGLFWIPWRSHAQFVGSYTVGFPGLRAASPESRAFLDPARDPVLRWFPLRVLAEGHRRGLDTLTSRFVGVRQEEHRLFHGVVADQAELLGRLVAAGTIPADAHVAMSCVGVIPYVTNLRTLDRFGLTDRVVAHSPAIEGWLMAHDKLATIEYAASAGVDFWAEDPVKCVLRATDPELRSLLDRAREKGEEVHFAETGSGILLGRLPQGAAGAAARFPALTFESTRDAAAAARLDARIEEAVRAAVAPGSREQTRLRASDLAAAGSVDEAIALLRDLEREGDYESAMMIGTLLANAGRVGEAVSSFERAAAARPDRDEPAYALGVALAKLERWDPAIEALGRAVAISPGNARAHYALGVAALAAGRADLAREQARELRALATPEALRLAGQLEEAVGTPP